MQSRKLLGCCRPTGRLAIRAVSCLTFTLCLKDLALVRKKRKAPRKPSNLTAYAFDTRLNAQKCISNIKGTMTSLLPSPATVAARGITSKASSALKEPLLGKQRDAPTQITVKTGETDDESIIKEEKMSVGNVLMTSVVCVMAAGGCKLIFYLMTRGVFLLSIYVSYNNLYSLLRSRRICSGHGINPVHCRYHCRGHLLP